MKSASLIEWTDVALAAHQLLLNSQTPSIVQSKHYETGSSTTRLVSLSETTPRLWGASATIFDNPHDLVALRVPADQDRLSEFIQNNFGLSFQTSAPDGRTTYTSERSISHFVAIFSTVLAAVLLFGAIISLCIVQNKHALLGMLSGWTVLFAGLRRIVDKCSTRLDIRCHRCVCSSASRVH